MTKKKIIIAAVVAVVLVAAGAGALRMKRNAEEHEARLFGPGAIPDDALEVLRHATSMQVYRLEPRPEPDSAAGALFRGFRVTATADVSSESQRRALASMVIGGVDESEGVVAMCFEPRHGVSASYGGKTVDFAICFQCLQAVVSGPGDGKTKTVITGTSHAEEIDGIFAALGMPRPAKSH